MAHLPQLIGAVTAVTGFDKGSGKTTFMNLARTWVRDAGPVALCTIGMDGAAKGHAPGQLPQAIPVAPGDVVLTTEAFARVSEARFEVLHALPWRSVLGTLLVGRALRGGSVTLVGPEHFSHLSQAIALIQDEGWATSVLVDGAVNRLTQVHALGQIQFVFTARALPTNLERLSARLKALLALADLPVDQGDGEDTHRVEGPLTQAWVQRLPPTRTAISLPSFTASFLDPPELFRLLAQHDVTVRQPARLLAVSVVLQGVSRGALLQAVGETVAPRVLFNPYEVAP